MTRVRSSSPALDDQKAEGLLTRVRRLNARPSAKLLTALFACFLVGYSVLALSLPVISTYADSTIYLPPIDGPRFASVNLWPGLEYTRAGWATQLVYAGLPSDGTRVGWQALTSAVAWSLSIGAVAIVARTSAQRVAVIAVGLLFGLSPLVFQWHSILLTESSTISAGTMLALGSIALVAGRNRDVPRWVVVLPVAGAVLLAFIRPGALTGGLPLLVYALVVRALHAPRDRKRVLIAGLAIAIATAYAGFAALQTNRVTDRTRQAAVYESREGLDLPVSPLGGFSAERSFYRGDERFWVDFEREHGRPRCDRFERTSATPERAALDVRQNFERKDTAVRSAIRACRTLDTWWRAGGVSVVEALRDPSVWSRYAAELGSEEWIPPVYHDELTGWDDLARVVFGPLGLIAAALLGLALSWWFARRVFVDWWSVGAVLGAALGAFVFGAITWYTTPLEPARHALPWTLLLPMVVVIGLSLGMPRRQTSMPSNSR